MQPYATVDDLKKRYPAIDLTDRERMEAFLEDASIYLNAALDNASIDREHLNDTYLHLLRTVCCSMVMRALPMLDDDEYTSAKTVQETVGAFTRMVTLANPTGDMYLTKSEKDLLGLTRKQRGVFQIFASSDILGGADEKPTL